MRDVCPQTGKKKKSVGSFRGTVGENFNGESRWALRVFFPLELYTGKRGEIYLIQNPVCFAGQIVCRVGEGGGPLKSWSIFRCCFVTAFVFCFWNRQKGSE